MKLFFEIKNKTDYFKFFVKNLIIIRLYLGINMLYVNMRMFFILIFPFFNKYFLAIPKQLKKILTIIKRINTFLNFRAFKIWSKNNLKFNP